MINNKSHPSLSNQPVTREALFAIRAQAWAMSFVCAVLALFALVAVAQVPSYVAAAAYGRLALFALVCVVLCVGIVHNICTHLALRRLLKEQ